MRPRVTHNRLDLALKHSSLHLVGEVVCHLVGGRMGTFGINAVTCSLLGRENAFWFELLLRASCSSDALLDVGSANNQTLFCRHNWLVQFVKSDCILAELCLR